MWASILRMLIPFLTSHFGSKFLLGPKGIIPRGLAGMAARGVGGRVPGFLAGKLSGQTAQTIGFFGLWPLAEAMLLPGSETAGKPVDTKLAADLASFRSPVGGTDTMNELLQAVALLSSMQQTAPTPQAFAPPAQGNAAASLLPLIRMQ